MEGDRRISLRRLRDPHGKSHVLLDPALLRFVLKRQDIIDVAFEHSSQHKVVLT